MLKTFVKARLNSEFSRISPLLLSRGFDEKTFLFLSHLRSAIPFNFFYFCVRAKEPCDNPLPISRIEKQNRVCNDLMVGW